MGSHDCTASCARQWRWRRVWRICTHTASCTATSPRATCCSSASPLSTAPAPRSATSLSPMVVHIRTLYEPMWCLQTWQSQASGSCTSSADMNVLPTPVCSMGCNDAVSKSCEGAGQKNTGSLVFETLIDHVHGLKLCHPPIYHSWTVLHGQIDSLQADTICCLQTCAQTNAPASGT